MFKYKVKHQLLGNQKRVNVYFSVVSQVLFQYSYRSSYCTVYDFSFFDAILVINETKFLKVRTIEA